MTKIKICGITNYEDAVNAANLGADYLGFNFYRKSPRYITKNNARKIIMKLPEKVVKVGIFVNEELEQIKKMTDFCNFDLVQLSGDESTEFIFNIKNRLNRKIIKSFWLMDRNDIKKVLLYQKTFSPKDFFVLLDSFKDGFYGGTGTKFDWNFAKGVDSKRLFLSGGLNNSNVRLAIGKVKPYAVDVCSSIEIRPGKKDFGKMRQFIEAAK